MLVNKYNHMITNVSTLYTVIISVWHVVV